MPKGIGFVLVLWLRTTRPDPPKPLQYLGCGVVLSYSIEEYGTTCIIVW